MSHARRSYARFCWPYLPVPKHFKETVWKCLTGLRKNLMNFLLNLGQNAEHLKADKANFRRDVELFC